MSKKALSRVISCEEDDGYVWPTNVNVEATAMCPKTNGAMALKMSIAALYLGEAKLGIAQPQKWQDANARLNDSPTLR